MAPGALCMFARQRCRDPNPDAVEDAACGLEAVAIGQNRQVRRAAAARRGDFSPDMPLVPRPPGPLRATMRAWEDDMEARKDVYRPSGGVCP